MSDTLIGIIGGSGLYQLDGLEQVCEQPIETPYATIQAPLPPQLAPRLGIR